MAFMFLWCRNTGITRKQSKISSRHHGASFTYIDCPILGQGQNLEAPLPLA
jgi:hypothetical protein